MSTAPDKIPENIDFAAQELLEASLLIGRPCSSASPRHGNWSS
jgi:hypothetical protein